MFRDCSDRSGVMPHVCSYEVTGECDEVVSNILFFLEVEEIEDYFWNIFFNTPPKFLDIRVFKNATFRSKGKVFTKAENPRQLSHALAHSLLGALVFTMMPLYLSNKFCFPPGWLSVYLSGYLHRDPSLG